MSLTDNSESTRPKYEPPCAVRLCDAASGLAAEGDCESGSHAAAICMPGSTPTANCSAGTGVGFFRFRVPGQKTSGH